MSVPPNVVKTSRLIKGRVPLTYICKSEPHIAVVVILTMTASGCSIFGFGTSLTLSLKGSWYSTAFIDMMIYLVRWAVRRQNHIYAGKHEHSEIWSQVILNSLSERFDRLRGESSQSISLEK